jgi:GNAT superfamily N-acetyltransferase
MSIQIVPFKDEHLEPAAALLARRHREARTCEPLLDPAFEDPAKTIELVRKAWTETAALDEGRLIGYILWQYVNTPPESLFAPFSPVDTVESPLAGLAVDPDATRAVRRLYAVASAEWVGKGRGSHEIHLPASDRSMLDEWCELGFGRWASFAVRTTATDLDVPTQSLEFRQATPADREAVCALARHLWISYCEPPLHFPFLPEVMPDLDRQAETYIEDPTTPVWLALHDGAPVALQLFIEPGSPHWFTSPLEAPPGSIYLFWASTDPIYRGSGANTALLARTLQWARQEGYEACSLNFLSASFAAEYWRRQGFRTVSHYLVRRLDPRAVAEGGTRNDGD